jgi:hypothetical protein
MKELYKALAAFQAEVPNIYKNAKGYGYNFADLDAINLAIKPLLTKHGLGYAQPLDGFNLKTIIFHVESGESIESSVAIPQGVQLAKMNEFQVLGSAITYLRRYSLSSILGLITDEDADAAGEQVKPKEIRNRTEEIKGGSEPMGETPEQKLARAKTEINTSLEAHNYTTPDSKRAFIKDVLQKVTIATIADAHSVMDALDAED